MKATIRHHKTIKVSVPVAKPTISDVPKFVAENLISTDDGNALTLGSDNKLYIPQPTILTKQDW